MAQGLVVFQSLIYHMSGKGGPIRIYGASSIILLSDWLLRAYLGELVEKRAGLKYL